MRFEDLTPEMIERAKKCETAEERLAFIQENGIELTEKQLEDVAGGQDSCDVGGTCPMRTGSKGHVWRRAGRTRPGKYFGNLWPDKEDAVSFAVTRSGLGCKERYSRSGNRTSGHERAHPLEGPEAVQATAPGPSLCLGGRAEQVSHEH